MTEDEFGIRDPRQNQPCFRSIGAPPVAESINKSAGLDQAGENELEGASEWAQRDLSIPDSIQMSIRPANIRHEKRARTRKESRRRGRASFR